MTLIDFIEELKQKKIEITFSNGKLKYSGPEGNITSELIENLKKYKGKLIKNFWPKELGNLMPINPEGNKIPLFIVHGDNSNYIISEYLGPDQPVYGFFHPGSEGEKILYKNAKEMAKAYLEKIKAVWPSGPFYLIGYSFGGILAFEMANILQKSGHKVPFLVLIDTVSPLAMKSKKGQFNLYRTIRYKILRPVRRGLKRKIKLFSYNTYFLTNRPLPAEKRGYYLHIKYLAFTRSYSPSKFDGNILLFRTSGNLSSGEYLGWENLANEIRLVEIDGEHLQIFTGEKRTELLQQEIGKYLQSVTGLN